MGIVVMIVEKRFRLQCAISKGKTEPLRMISLKENFDVQEEEENEHGSQVNNIVHGSSIRKKRIGRI